MVFWEEDGDQSQWFLNYRTLLFTEGTPIFEILWSFSSEKDYNPKILNEIAPLYTLGQYGLSVIQKLVTVLDDHFSITYWDNDLKTLTVVTYYASPDEPLREISRKI